MSMQYLRGPVLAAACVLLSLSSLSIAQVDNQSVTTVTSDPTGKSCAAGTGAILTTTGILYTCQGGVYAVYSGGSGTFVTLSGDATSTSVGGSTIVRGINGTLLSSLGTGILKNTTTTGVPSIAAASDVVSIFGSGSCSGYLKSDGTCGNPTGSMTWPSTAGISVYSGSNSWGTSLTAPSGAIVGTTDTQTLTNKTVDGVTPTVFGYLDPTSSVQTQLNGKQATLSNYSTISGLTGYPSSFTPSAHASTHQFGGSDLVGTATPAANSIPMSGSGGTLAAGWIPTLNQSTTGNAATATALASTPTKCSAGNYPLGIDASGNAQNCTASGGSYTAPELSAFNLPTPMVLDGVTDDSAALNSAVAGTTVVIPGGKTALISNWSPNANVKIRCGAGATLKKLSSATTTYMFHPNGTGQGIEGCIIDANATTQTTSNLFTFFIDTATNFRLVNNTIMSSGSPSNTMGAVLMYNSTGSIYNNTISIPGTQIRVDGRTGKSVTVANNILSGSQGNAIYITDSETYTIRAHPLPIVVSGNYISSVTDGFSGTGQTGNAIVVFQADGVKVEHNTAKTIRFTGVRVDLSADVDVGGNTVDGAQETSMYAELGASSVNFHDNDILNFNSGINLTNVSQRSPDDTNTAVNNRLTNGTYYGIKGEHDFIRGNSVESVPFCYLVGFGSTSHDNVLQNNTCTHNNSAFTPVAVAVGVDKSINSGGVNLVAGQVSGTTTITPAIFPVSLPDAITITGITKATSGVVTFNAGTQPPIGSTVCFASIFGMVELNGLCPTVAASTSTTVTLNLNTSAFTTFTAGTGGQKSYGATVYSSGTTPNYSFPSASYYLSIPNVDSTNAANLTSGTVDTARLGSGMASSSTFLRGDSTWASPGGSGTVTVVGSGSLTSTALVTGGGTTTLQTPSATATMDSSGNISTPGTITSAGGFASSGASSGSITLSGSTSGAVTQTVPAAAGTATVTWGSGTGTPAVTASSPLGITTSTGNITCSTCVVSTSPGAGIAHFAGSTQAVTSSPVVSTDTDNSIAKTGVDINTSNQVTATHLASALPVAQGGTGTTSTLTGLVRGSASAMTAAELSGDATTSGSNAVTLAAKYKTWSCETGIGDGLNAVPAGTYLQSFCYNTTGVTVTLTGVKCYIDGGTTSTLNAAGNTLGALLTGAVTCSTSFAAGTQSANVALTSTDYIKFTWVADGTAKQTTWVVTGTY